MNSEIDLTKIHLDKFNGYKIVYLSKDCPFAYAGGLFTKLGLPMTLGKERFIAVYTDVWDKLDINARKVILVKVTVEIVLNDLQLKDISTLVYSTIINCVGVKGLGYYDYFRGIKLCYDTLLDDLDWHDYEAHKAVREEMVALDNSLIDGEQHGDLVRDIALLIFNKESSGKRTQYIGADEAIMQEVRKLYKI